MTGGARPPTLRIERVSITHPDALRLVEEVQGEYVVRYGGRDDTPLDQDAFEAPRGAFFVGYRDAEPVTTGAWRLRDDLAEWGADFGLGRGLEIKRMYVVPSARRLGFAAAMLAHLEHTGAEAGARFAVLETGTAQPEALGLYTAYGYEPVPKFGHYRCAPESRCFGRVLAPTP